jgi:hypothetical protein
LTLLDVRTERASRPALYVAALSAAYLAAAALIKVLSGSVVEVLTAPDLFVIGMQWADFASSMFRYVVVFSLGVFLVLWLIAPISAGITLRLTIARAAVAVVGGALLTVVAGLILGIAGTLSSSLFGARMPAVDGLGYQVVGAVQGFFATTVELGPVVLLAAILVWLRLRARAAVTND